MFKGFKPQGIQKIANRMGYQGGMENFDNYLEQNPNKKREMIVYEEAAKRMARGGVVRLQEGGTLPDKMVEQALNPALPTGGKVVTANIPQADSQFIDEGTGQVGQIEGASVQTAGTATADPVEEKSANKIEAVQTAEGVDSALNALQAAQTDPNDPRAKVTAAEQTKSAVGD